MTCASEPALSVFRRPNNSLKLTRRAALSGRLALPTGEAHNPGELARGPSPKPHVPGGFVFCAGQGGTDPATGKLVDGGIKEQARQTIRNIRTILEAAGSDLDHVAMVTVLLHDWEYFEGMNQVFAEAFRREATGTIHDPR